LSPSPRREILPVLSGGGVGGTSFVLTESMTFGGERLIAN
jgi:hypothetical protein